jgi:carboxylesterase type B
LRFREPQDPLKWPGVREAVLEGPICPQIKIFDWLFAGNEDCLYLDVYAPAEASPTNLKPVFVWIYGTSQQTSFSRCQPPSMVFL